MSPLPLVAIDQVNQVLTPTPLLSMLTTSPRWRLRQRQWHGSGSSSGGDGTSDSGDDDRDGSSNDSDRDATVPPALSPLRLTGK